LIHLFSLLVKPW